MGGTTAEDAANSLAVGLGAQTTLPDSIALGSGAVADRAKYDGTDNKYTAYLGDDIGTTKTGSAWRSTANAIAIGHIDTDDTKSVTRQITGVAAGTYDTDAVNVAQLKAATSVIEGSHNYYETTETNPVKVTDAVNAVDSALGKVAAGNYVTVFTPATATTQATGTFADNLTALDTALGKIETVSTGSYLTAYDATGTTPVGTFADNLKALDAGLGEKITTDGNYIKASGTNSINANIQALDTAIGKVDADKNYITAANSVSANMVALDTRAKTNADDIVTLQTKTQNITAVDGTTTMKGVLNVADSTDVTTGVAIDGNAKTITAGGVAIDGAANTLQVGDDTGISLSNVISGNNVTNTLNVGGVTISDNGTAKTVTGLSNTTWDAANITTGQAATEDQLKLATTALTDGGLKFTANSGGEVTNKLGSTVSVTGGGTKTDDNYSDSNVKTMIAQDAAGNSTITVKLDKNPSFDSLTASGDIRGANIAASGVLSGTGLTLSGGNPIDDTKKIVMDGAAGTFAVGSNVYISSEGLNANNQKITGVANGTDTYDAVNLGQVTTMIQSGNTFTGVGPGLAVSSGKLEVNAGEGLTFDDKEHGNALKVDKTAISGNIKANDTGFVTGGEVHSALAGKANVDLDNISDNGKAVVRGLAKESVKVVAGTYTTVTEGTVGNATTYTVNVKADGTVTSGNTGLVTGGTVYSALQAFQPDGTLAADSAKAVSGATVFGEVRPTADGSYVKKESTTGENLSALDTAVKTNAGSLLALDTTVKTNVDRTRNITATEGVTTIDGTLNAGAITASGAISGGSLNVGTGAITGGMATVSGLTIGSTNLTTALTTVGKVEANNLGFVTGGTVYGETRLDPTGTYNYISKDNSAAANLQALDTQVKANADALSGKAEASTVTALSNKISANESALTGKADKANTLKGYGIEDAYTKEDTDTLLKNKADKTELEKVKATANSNKKALDALGDVQDLAKDAEAVKKIANDVETVVKEQDGAVAAEGQKGADELVKGSTVYDYLNKGKDGNGKLVLGTESRTITMGKGSETTGDETITMGFNNQVNGNQNVTIGTKHMVKGDSNTVIGDPDNITGNKNVVLANDTNITGSRNVAIGNNITINGDDTFVMGNNVTANESNAVVLGNGSTAETDAVSVGSKDGERQIKHVKAGTDPTDAATVGQVQEVAQGAYNNAVYLSNSINKLDNRVNKVGAGAAALAALHPIDTDDKFTMGMGYGNYRSAHAMAMGMFYRPTEKIMISVGGAFGNGENMVNAGISFALDKGKGFGTSKAVMAKNIKALSAENAAIKEENAGMKKQLDAQGQEIAALKEALARLEAKIGK